MSLQLDETTRGIWFCATIPGEQDFLLTLNRIAEDHYGLTYRFRYYNSDDPFDTEDKKSWYAGEIKNRTEEEVIRIIHDEVMPTLAGAVDFVELLRGDQPFDDFMDNFMEQDFVHAKKVH